MSDETKRGHDRELTARFQEAFTAALAQGVKAGSRWLHAKRGIMVKVVGFGVIEGTLAPAVSYVHADPTDIVSSVVWHRPIAEFLDGRFLSEVEDDK